MASLKWVKQVTEIGLTLMRPNAMKERLEDVVGSEGANATSVDFDKLVALIDECVAASGAYLEKHSDRISETDAEVIRTQLGRIDGRAAVDDADPIELAEWITDIKKSA